MTIDETNESAASAGRWSRWPATLALAMATVGCAGYATQPTLVTTNSATLQAQGQCTANTTNNPCTVWFQYWEDAAGIQETPHIVGNVNTNGFFPLNQPVTALNASTLYHYQVCGFGDSNLPAPGKCGGPLVNSTIQGLNLPGTKPNVGDLNATVNFRTAGPGTQATIDLGRVLSGADLDTNPISRDAGFSVRYSTNPPKSLWVFADTQQNHVGFIPYGTAAAGPSDPGQAPTALNELPTPPLAPTPGLTAPSAFFPAPTGLLTTDSPPQPCGADSYAADWVVGGAKIPNQAKLLLAYSQICVQFPTPTRPEAPWVTEKLALGEYTPGNNKFTATSFPFVASPLQAGLPPQKHLGSPVFGGDGYLYMFARECTGAFCSTVNALYVARVTANATNWRVGANYRWWNGTTWVADHTQAASVASGLSWLGLGNVTDFSAIAGHKYVFIEQTGFGNAAFRVWEATSPIGPWTAVLDSQAPDACTGAGFACYAVTGHPDLSTASQLVYSWYSSDDRDGYGHVRIGAVGW